MYIYLLKKPKPGDRCITYPVELHLFFFIPRGTPLFLHESCLTQQLLLCSIHEAMRDGLMRKFVILPFSLGCVSHSSIALGENQPKTAQEEPPPATPSGELEKKSMAGKTKSSFGLRAAPTIQKLIKSIKSLSQLFAVYEEEDEEIEMEIGFPTDVQHVAHIGWDGFNSMSTMNMKSWAKDPDFFSLPSRSVR